MALTANARRLKRAAQAEGLEIVHWVRETVSGNGYYALACQQHGFEPVAERLLAAPCQQQLKAQEHRLSGKVARLQISPP